MALKINQIDWTEPRPSNGRYFRIAREFPEDFWEHWEDDKTFLKKLGLSPFKNDDGLWVLAWWTDEEHLPNQAPPPDVNNLPPLPPITSKLGDTELFPPQVIHTQHLVRSLRKFPAAVDTSEVGTGKTICAIMAAHNLGLHPFVICPKVVISSWKKWAEMAGIRLDVVNYEQAIRGNHPFIKRTDKKRPAYMQFEWNLRTPEGYLAIFDEAHRVKGQESLTSCLLSSAKRIGVKTLILSATLIENPMDMKAIGYVMGFHHWSNWETFLRSNGCFTQTQQHWKWIRPKGGKPFKKKVPVDNWIFAGGKKAMQKLHSQIFPAMGHGLQKSDMKGYFPDNLIIPMSVDIGKTESVWKAMRKELRELEAKKKRDVYRGDSKLTIMLRAQQEAELLKVPAIIERAKDLEEEGHSVVIFSQFRESLDKIRDSLNAVSIVGNQSEQEREDAINNFQNDKENFICVQLQAGGAGVSLHQEKPSNRPRASLLIPSFDGRLFAQALGRIHRANATDTVRQYIIFDGKSKTDQRVCSAIEKKMSNINAFNGDYVEDIAILEE